MTLRIASVVVAAVVLTAQAEAYSFFTHYTNSAPPYSPVPQKFDLAALPNRTVQVMVGDVSLGQVSDAARTPSLLHHIREAASVWNGIQASDLRVAFGGLTTIGLQQSTPAVDVIFDELPPFVLGYASPSVTGQLTTGPNGAFVPIKRSLVRLNRDLAAWAGLGPSFHEAFFLTTVHELGHALGLQHSFVAGAMATESTRSMTKARPIDADDRAGISRLYPTADSAGITGSIFGQVTFEGGNQGVHLAEVVAIRPNGSAISVLTEPDGRYRLESIPPDTYLLYVHPLPPPLTADQTAGDLLLPVLPSGDRVPVSGYFDTVFYGGGNGVRDLASASTFEVIAGVAFDGIDFRVRRRAAVAIPAIATYSYFDGGGYVKPAVLNGAGGTLTIVAAGSGITSGQAVAPGLGVGFLGGVPQLIPGDGIRAFNGGSSTFLALYVQPTSAFGLSGSRHMIFSLPGDVYVRPYGATFVSDKPPSITETAAGSNSTLLISGKGLKPDTAFAFDGVAAQLLRFDDSGRAVVAIPPGINGAKTTLTAFNRDGQNSMFVQAPAPAVYTYDQGEPGSVTLSPASSPAGGDTLIEINGINTSFVDGLTKVGFGSADVLVRQVWVLSPSRLWVNVSIAADAPAVQTLVSVVTGFQVISQPFAFTVRSAPAAAPLISSKVVNTLPGQIALFPGAPVTVTGAGLGGAVVTVNDQTAAVLASSPVLLTFQIPAGLPARPTLVRITTPGGSAVIAISIDPVPPEIASVTLAGGAALDAAKPALPGDMLVIAVTGLVESGTPAPQRVAIKVGGVLHQAVEITADGSKHLISFVLLPSVPAEKQIPLVISINGRTSNAVLIPVGAAL